jgi:hypothetical protein
MWELAARHSFARPQQRCAHLSGPGLAQAGHRPVRITPLSLSALQDAIPGLGLFQIVQITPARLRVRLQPAAGADPDEIWATVRARLTELLDSQHVAEGHVERADEAPQPSAGGKYRLVQPFQGPS